MKEVFIALLILFIMIMLFCTLKSNKIGTPLAKKMRNVLGFAMLSAISSLLMNLMGSKGGAVFFKGMFYASIDWVLLGLLEFVQQYTGVYKVKTATKRVIQVLAFAEFVSMALDVCFEHAYTIKEYTFAGEVFWGIERFGVPFYLHLGFCYILVVFALWAILQKMIHSPRIYKKKYSLILIAFAVMLLADGVGMIMDLPFDMPVLFYGLISAMLFYFSLYYSPQKILTQTLELAVDDMDDAIFCYDIDGKCVYMNTFGKKIFLTDEKDYTPVEVLFAKWMKDNGDNPDDVIKTSEVREVDGRKLYLDVIHKKLYESGKLVGYSLKIADRTSEVESYEREIRLAEEASKAKSRFLSQVSHEIRTPVNSISGMNEMILRESGEEVIRRYAQDIKISAETLITIINDVLDFSKIESGKMPIVEAAYDTQEMLQNVIRMSEVKAREKNLAFEIQIQETLPKKLYGDAVRIKQILMNLLSNAVKYTSEGVVTFVVKGQALADKKYKLLVEVKDTGMGIREEDIPKLCTAFERMDEERNHSIQGTGLGLNITDQLLKRMGSSMEIDSVYGEGSNFHFALEQTVVDESPIGVFQKERVVEQDTKYEASFVAPKARILVVDDNVVNRKVFCRLLKQTQVQITDVGSGAACLDMVQENHYDLIFLDHMMPEMDGIETFEQMNQREHRCKGVPVIMLTANAIEGAREEYLEAGFDDFLSKPIEPDKLERMIYEKLPRELLLPKDQ